MAVRRRFNRLASAYDRNSDIERDVAERLLVRLEPIRLQARRIVDLGCATGGNSKGLRAKFPGVWCCGVDFAEAMLRQKAENGAFHRWLPMRKAGASVCANAGALPIASSSIDLVWSNLLLPWCDDPYAVFTEAYRVLREGGLLSFSTLGPDSLKELRGAFRDSGLRFQPLADMHDLGDMMIDAGYSDPVVDMEMVHVSYRDVDQLLSDLRSTGGNCLTVRPRGMLGRRKWEDVHGAFADAVGSSGVTLELIFGHAWKVGSDSTSSRAKPITFFPRRPR